MPPAAWIAAARPRTLGAAAVPVLAALALAARIGALRPVVAAVTLAAAVAIQITTNFANDYFDGVHGADGPDRLGPPRMSQGGPGAARAMRTATVVAGTVAALLGATLVAVGGWPILGIGVASLIAAVAYTGGPYPLAYHGWGDLFVLTFFGPVAVWGTLHLQAVPFDARALAVSMSLGALATAMLVVNNLRDIASDARVGKRTLAVQLGTTAMRVWYGVLVGTAFGSAVLAGTWLPLLAAPLGILEAVRVGRRAGGALNVSLAGTARLHLVVGVLLALGVMA
jgi:1,4-dihydroxy-2-naphthoate octaprenyltransferase